MTDQTVQQRPRRFTVMIWERGSGIPIGSVRHKISAAHGPVTGPRNPVATVAIDDVLPALERAADRLSDDDGLHELVTALSSRSPEAVSA